jgi:hypothetical protein
VWRNQILGAKSSPQLYTHSQTVCTHMYSHECMYHLLLQFDCMDINLSMGKTTEATHLRNLIRFYSTIKKYRNVCRLPMYYFPNSSPRLLVARCDVINQLLAPVLFEKSRLKIFWFLHTTVYVLKVYCLFIPVILLQAIRTKSSHYICMYLPRYHYLEIIAPYR